jgi:hypothetical protein
MVITEELLNWLGYSAEKYYNKKPIISKSLNERRLYNRGMRTIRRWVDVPHAVDIGNELKRKGRRLNWYARGNTIRLGKRTDGITVDDDYLIQMINVI